MPRTREAYPPSCVSTVSVTCSLPAVGLEGTACGARPEIRAGLGNHGGCAPPAGESSARTQRRVVELEACGVPEVLGGDEPHHSRLADVLGYVERPLHVRAGGVGTCQLLMVRVVPLVELRTLNPYTQMCLWLEEYDFAADAAAAVRFLSR